MKSIRVFAVLLMLAAGAAWCQDVASEQKKLDGTWTPMSAELGGKAFDAETLKTIKLVITGEKYTVTVGEAIDKGVVKLDLGKKPKAMDIIGKDGPNKDKTYLAIYELDGDKLRVCYDLTGKGRPGEFKSPKGELVFLVTYERAKK